MLTFHCKTPGTADSCHNKDNSLIEVLFYKFLTGLLAVANCTKNTKIYTLAQKQNVSFIKMGS